MMDFWRVTSTCLCSARMSPSFHKWYAYFPITNWFDLMCLSLNFWAEHFGKIWILSRSMMMRFWTMRFDPLACSLSKTRRMRTDWLWTVPFRVVEATYLWDSARFSLLPERLYGEANCWYWTKVRYSFFLIFWFSSHRFSLTATSAIGKLDWNPELDAGSLTASSRLWNGRRHPDFAP